MWKGDENGKEKTKLKKKRKNNPFIFNTTDIVKIPINNNIYWNQARGPDNWEGWGNIKSLDTEWKLGATSTTWNHEYKWHAKVQMEGGARRNGKLNFKWGWHK